MLSLPPDAPAPVYLDVQQWNAVLGALAEMPYRVSAPLIQAIMLQLQRPPPEATAGPNGSAPAREEGDPADVSY